MILWNELLLQRLNVGTTYVRERDRFSPVKCLRTSLSEHHIGEVTDDVPLYAVSTLVADYLS